jgi:hypothetical protein
MGFELICLVVKENGYLMSSLTFLRQILMSTFVVLVCIPSVSAVVIEDLYDAKVAVSDQAEATQNKAIKQALKQVFVKVSGSESLLSDAKIVKQLNQASTLIRSYTYEKNKNQLYLVVNFDQEKIQNVLRASGFAVWDKRRPDTLLWLAIEDKQQDKQIISQETQRDFVQRLLEQSQVRGIKVVVPLWDLVDLQNVNIYDIWGGFSQPLLLASERYDLSTFLSARIYLEPIDALQAQNKEQHWLADWLMLDNGQVSSGQISLLQSDLMAKEIVNIVAKQLSDKYAINMQNRLLNMVKMQITLNNVNSITRYAAILKFLNGLSVVANATLVKQQGEKATFELELLGNNQDLLNTFMLDNKIRPISAPAGQEQTILEFMWNN